MPTYEFVCDNCHKPFTLIMKLTEFEEKKIVCPACASDRVTQQISNFQTITSKKS